MRYYLLAFTTLLFVSTASAKDINQIFEELRNSGENYEIVGAVCEQVARLELAEQYRAPQYEVITGIEYGDKSRTIGELDVVVFNRHEDKAVVVAEVKCWDNATAGARKAAEQRKRFQNVVSTRKTVKMQSKKESFDINQFFGVIKYMAISYQGTRKNGYEMELEYTLEELMMLRKELMKCQATGECLRPNPKN